MPNNKKNDDSLKNIPSLDDILKNNPPKSQEEIGHIEYTDKDEEEEMDTTFSFEPWEEKFYDEEGNFIENP